ncbi:MAG: hypothetical protein ACYC0L_06605 [Thermoleophilia bacterium]
MEGIAVLDIGGFLIARAAPDESQEISLSGLIFLLPFVAFYSAVAIVYLSMVKRPVKVATVAVYVVCGLGGAIGSMLAYTAVFTEGGDTDSTLVVLAGFGIALVCSIIAGGAGVIALAKLLPKYEKRPAGNEDTK